MRTVRTPLVCFLKRDRFALEHAGGVRTESAATVASCDLKELVGQSRRALPHPSQVSAHAQS
jgi:hypothetical protein